MIASQRLRRLTFLLALGLCGLASHAAAQEGGVKWRSEYNAARKEAGEKGLPLLIDFGKNACPWCDKLDADTFTNPDVVKTLSEKFIPLKIRLERDPSLCKMLGIEAYPTVVMAAPDGKILNTVVGFEEATKFQDSMQRAIAQVTPPDWMRKDLAQAQKWLEAGDLPRAINALKIIVEDGKGKGVQEDAQKLLADLEKRAEKEMERARALQEKGETTKAIEVVTETMRTFPGLNATREATAMLTKIAVAAPDERNKFRLKRAQELLTQAREFYKNKDFIPCLDRCEILVAGFGDLAEGQDGALLVAEIKNNPDWLQGAADTMSERLGGVYLALADSLLKRGQPDRATFYLNRVVTAFPGSRLAESAQIRLEQLQGSGVRATTGVTAKGP